jgi:EAL domain-containing protein (putative c-di-GMP-specific phosphodiesterase class I)
MEFIPIAEGSLAIIPIGQWVLEQVCHQIVKWKKYTELKTVAANVSSVQLTDAAFVNSVRELLITTGCPGHLLEIEQTESWLMDDSDNNVEILKQLKTLDIKLSLDDFGTAYSSLSQLGRLPLDVLKIDKSFIDNCVHNHSDHMIVRTIIQLGHNLGMTIVAEGVEYEAQRALLASEGCDTFQGYLFSKPVSASEFELLLEKNIEGSS